MANLAIRFVNCDRSPALETYAETHLHRLLTRLDRRRGQNKSIELQFKDGARTPDGELSDVEVSLTYRYPGLRKPLHFRKHGMDPRSTLIDVIDAAENTIQKETEKKETGRRTLGHTKQAIRELFRRRAAEKEEESFVSP